MSQETHSVLDKSLAQHILTDQLSPHPVYKPGKRAGYLRLWIGPMYAGKSSRLMTALTTYADLDPKIKVMYINHVDDIRETCGDDAFSTHSSQYKGLSPKITPVKTDDLTQVNVSEYQVIGIDETQFFTHLVKTVDQWVTHDHKIVLCAGLDGDCFRRPMGETLFLIPLADKVSKHTAACHQCLRESMATETPTVVKAPLTARLIDSSEQKLPGGADIYAPLCRYHYTHHMKLKI